MEVIAREAGTDKIEINARFVGVQSPLIPLTNDLL